jgi:hypothetical protein
MKTSVEKTVSSFRVICLHPPLADCIGIPATFGLQDKSSNLYEGERHADGAMVFEGELTVKYAESGQPDFAGSFAQGPKGGRFLYLSLGCREGNAWNWLRRIKIPLSGLTAEQLSAGGVLEATIDGQRSGTVPLVGGGWIVRDT